MTGDITALPETTGRIMSGHSSHASRRVTWRRSWISDTAVTMDHSPDSGNRESNKS